MEKYEKYELLLGRKLNAGDKRLIDYGLAIGNKITIENGTITVSSRLTPEQEKMYAEAKQKGTLCSASISCQDIKEKSERTITKSLYASDEVVFGEPVIAKVEPAQISKTSKRTRLRNFLKKISDSILGEKSITHIKKR